MFVIVTLLYYARTAVDWSLSSPIIKRCHTHVLVVAYPAHVGKMSAIVGDVAVFDIGGVTALPFPLRAVVAVQAIAGTSVALTT